MFSSMTQTMRVVQIVFPSDNLSTTFSNWVRANFV